MELSEIGIDKVELTPCLITTHAKRDSSPPFQIFRTNSNTNRLTQMMSKYEHNQPHIKESSSKCRLIDN